jgi:hypothetical protein
MFFTGVFFGIPAGYLEEIGWMGFAFEKLHARGTAFRAAVILGLMRGPYGTCRWSTS